MELLIFKTDIKTKKKMNIIQPVFNQVSLIRDWTIDIEDIDNVLRIEGENGLTEEKIIELINTCGFNCETLPD